MYYFAGLGIFVIYSSFCGYFLGYCFIVVEEGEVGGRIGVGSSGL